jgi:hypothetical protein
MVTFIFASFVYQDFALRTKGLQHTRAPFQYSVVKPIQGMLPLSPWPFGHVHSHD